MHTFTTIRKFVLFFGVVFSTICFSEYGFSGTDIHVLYRTRFTIKSELTSFSGEPGERRFEAVEVDKVEPITIKVWDIALVQKLRDFIENKTTNIFLIDEQSQVYGFFENDDLFVPGSLFISYDRLSSASGAKPFPHRLIKLEKTKALGFGKKIELEIDKWPVASVVTKVDDSLKPEEKRFNFGGLKIIEKLFVASKAYQYDKTFVLNQMTSLYFSELNVDLFRLRYNGDDLVVAAEYQIVFFSEEPRKIFILATRVLEEADLEFQKPNSNP